MASIVLKVGGNVVLDAAQVALVASECKALKAAGHTLTLVHGGGPQLDKALAALGEPIRKVDGLRVTSERAAHVVEDVMNGIGAELAQTLQAHGLDCHHFPADGTFEAKPKSSAAGDLGRVGTVLRVRPPTQLLAGVAGSPLFTPVGHDAKGPLNVNADEGAAAVACALHADWLVLATDVAAVRGEQGEALSRLNPAQARALIGGAAVGGMIPKLTSALSAIDAGVRNVLITRLQPGTLTDAVLHGRFAGTLVQAGAVVAK